MQPYSLDLRSRVAAACQLPGACKTAVARRFGVSCTFVQSLLRQQRETGSLASKPARGGRARFLNAAAQAWLGAYVQQHPDLTLAELGAAWQAGGGPDLPVAGAGRAAAAAQKKKAARHGT
jgi:transposase